MNLKYKAILFDNDGTLVDTEECIMTSVKHVFHEVLGDKNVDLNEFRKLIGLPSEAQFAYYSDDKNLVDKMVNEYRRHNDSIVDKLSKNFDGLPDVLKTLYDTGFFMGIVTSKRHDICVHGLKLLGLDSYFSYIQGSEDWHVHKPEPGALSHACEMIQCKPNEVLYIGDSIYDMQSGKGANCDTCAVTWGVFDEKDLSPESPNFIAREPKDLLKILEVN